VSIVNVGKHLHEVGASVEIGSLTMRYDDGGRVEVWTDAKRSVRVRGGASEAEIAAAFREESDAN
jgi:hypothetical protein